MPRTDVIILAGGLGTRLSPTIGEKPKAMAQIAGRPFLEYQLSYLRQFDLVNVVLSVGHLKEQIINHFGNFWHGSTIVYAIEKEPLGTGGAVKEALRYCTSEVVLIMNGDTLFDINLNKMYDLYIKRGDFEMIVALRRVKDAGRYGLVERTWDHRIREFREKDPDTKSGLVNAGIYLMKRSIVERKELPEKFSLERDFFALQCKKHKFLGVAFRNYFIDIGIPEDFDRGQKEIPLIKRFNEFYK
ncbi:MAG: NTP transferase domain-containing protein [Bacteroidetes bacterium]|nr:NTP transferase domain-containing protein [Bacteroidota bacterium]